MRTPHLRLVLLLSLITAAVALAACGDDDDGGDSGGGATTAAPAAAIQRDDANAKTTITVGSKNFTEQKVLGEVYAQALAAGGYTVRKELNLGDEQTALKSLKGGDVDAYPEYTGTALLSFFDVKTEDLPKDAGAAYEQVKRDFAKDGIVAEPPTPFTSSNEVAVTKATAQKHGLTKISDLSKVAGQLSLYGSPECRQRLDCLLGLQQVYGLKFKRFVPVELSQRSKVLSDGQADVSIVFTTDPQNKRDGFVLLQDDKGMFPPYNSTLLVRDATAKAAGPDLTKIIEAVNAKLDASVIQELNARVDLDKETPEQAAREYLQQFGLIAK
jgi:osmoprotectant transport system substrate-binding protein